MADDGDEIAQEIFGFGASFVGFKHSEGSLNFTIVERFGRLVADTDVIVIEEIVIFVDRIIPILKCRIEQIKDTLASPVLC